MMRRRFCYTCERERIVEFECRACGDRECALCVDGTVRLCATCAYEAKADHALRELVGGEGADGGGHYRG